MKNLFFLILFWVVTFATHASTALKVNGSAGLISANGEGVRSVNGSTVCNTQIGTIFTDDFNRANSATIGNNWVKTGGVTANINSTYLELIGSGSQLHRVVQSGLTNCGENLTVSAQYALLAPMTISTHGIAIGVVCPVNPALNYAAQIGTATGSAGKVVLYRWDGTIFNEIASSGGTVLPYTAGDTLLVTFKQIGATYYATGRNVTQNSSSITVSAIGDLLTLSGTTNIFNSGPKQVCVWSIGGTSYVKPITLSNLDYTRPDTLGIGDSIMFGAHVTNQVDAWFGQLAASRPSRRFVRYAAPAATTVDMIGATNEIAKYYPKRAIMMIGGNDIYFSVASATYKTNYLNLNALLQAQGADVWHGLATPRTATDIRALNTFINASFPTNHIMDTFTPLVSGSFNLGATYNSGDDIHPNYAGHALMYTTVRALIP